MILDLKRIFLNENESCSVQTEFALTDASLGMNSIPGNIHADITVGNHAGVVVLDAEAYYRFHGFCDRCLREFDKDYASRFHHMLVVSLPDEGDDDYIEAPDYMLDTDALLRDDILLELPSKFLCKDSCKGLCPKCGKNLNEGKCNCPEREPDPRLAALSRLLEE